MADELDLTLHLKGENENAKATVTDLRSHYTREISAMGQVGQRVTGDLQKQITSLASSVPVIGGPLSSLSSILIKAGSDGGASVDKLKDRLAGLEAQAVRVRNRFTDFEKGLQLTFAGAVNTDFLRQIRGATNEAERLDLIAAKFGKSFERQVVPVERAAFQFAKLERDGQAALNAIEGKAAKLTTELGRVEAGAVSAASGIGGMAGPIGVTALALTAAAGGAIVLTKVGYDLARSAAEQTGRFIELRAATGFSVETLSALDLVAQRFHKTIDSLYPSLGLFDKAIHKAEEGDRKMVAAFKELNITSHENDKALSQAILNLSKMEDSGHRTALALQVFGKGGKEMLKVVDEAVREANGDFDLLKEKLAAAGLLISTDVAEAGKEASESFRLFDQQIAAVKRQIGEQLMPVMTGMIRDLTDFMRDNPDAVHAWGETFVSVIQEIIGSIKELIDWVYQAGAALDDLGRFVDGLNQTAFFGLYPKAYGDEDSPLGSTSGGFTSGVYRGGGAVPTESGVGPISPEELKRRRDAADAANAALFGRRHGDSDEEGFTPKAGGGRHKRGGGGKSAAEQEAEEQVKLAELQLKDYQRIARQINAELQRNITLRGSLIDEDKEKQIAAEIDIYNARLNVINKKEIELKFEKNAKVRAVKLQELGEECTQIETDFQEAINKIDFDAGQKRIETLNRTLDAHQQILRDKLQAELDLLHSEAVQRVTTAEQTAREEGRIRLEQLKLDETRLNERRAQYNADSEEYKRLSRELGILENQRGYIVAETNRKVAEGRRKDIEDFQDYINELRKLQNENTSIMLDLGQQVIDFAVQQGAHWQYTLQAQKEHDKALELQRHKAALQEINDERRRVDQMRAATKAEFEARLALQVQLDKKEEAERLRHQLADRKIDDDAERARKKREHPFTTSIAETIGLNDQLAQHIKEVGAAGLAWEQFGETAGEAISGVANGIGSIVYAWATAAQDSDISLKKIVNSVLAAASAQAAVQAVMFTAYGIAALTPWGAAIYGPASQWFIAAGLMASIAIGTGLAARAFASSSADTGSAAGRTLQNNTTSNTSNNNGPTPIVQNRNQPPQPRNQAVQSEQTLKGEITLNLNLDKNGVLNVVHADIQNNGRTKRMIVKLAKAA